MDDLVEFYVSCNPPLRPNGVKYVLDQLRESKIEHIEVLYEPTVPWMQCLATRRQRNALANFLTSRLHEILVRETGDFELDPQAGDIEIIAEDPMILSWGAFLQLGQQELDEYEPYRYPDAFRRFAFKSIWQRLRSMDVPQGLDVRRLLRREGDPEWSFKAFMGLTGCQASYNIQQDVLYLGCDTSALIGKATRKLNSLFEYMRHATPPATQLVLPAAAGNDWRLSLRPISTFGSAQSTIIRTTAVTANNDYRDLYAKGVVVTYAFADLAGEGRGVSECPLADQAPSPRKKFVAFVDYSYPTKEATEKPSAPDTTPDRTLPKPVSHDSAAIVADWVRETGEARETDKDRLLSDVQTPDLGPVVLDEHQLQAYKLGEEGHQQLEHSRCPNLLEREDPCPEAGPVLNIWSSQIGSAPRKVVRNGAVEGDQFRNGDGLSTQGDGRSVNDAAFQAARTGRLPFPTSAVADLVGLFIPNVEETMVPRGEDEDVGGPRGLDGFIQISNSKTSTGGDIAQQKSRVTSQIKSKPIVRDLLGMVDETGLQNLMVPMMPTQASREAIRGRSPPREYRRTMNQKAARKERNRVQQNRRNTERVSPSPPPSARARSRIPIRTSSAAAKGGTAGSGARDIQAVTPRRTKEKSLAPTLESTVPRGAHLRGSWNTGIGGRPYDDVTLSPMIRASIEKRLSFEKAFEEFLVGMARRAKMLAGKVSMDIVFGRIVVNNVHEDAINLGGMDSFEPNYTPIRFLQELAVFNMDDLRFHSILSLHGDDANKLGGIHWTSDERKKWALHDKHVFYDFNCRDLGSNCCFTVQVNAEDFTFTFESSQKHTIVDLGFIHCPSRSWDLKACLKATDSTYFEDKYTNFAKSLVESLAVPKGLGCGNPRLSFDEYGQYRVSVDQVRVRHVARYRDGHDGNTFLNITMWQATNMDWDAVDDSNRSTRHIRVEPSVNDDTKGLANTWYEASISSVRAERVFGENAGMEFGDEATWGEEKLREEGVFKSLYLPAISMLEQMDGVGSGNDNGRNPFAGTVPSVTDTKVGELKKGLFW